MSIIALSELGIFPTGIICEAQCLTGETADLEGFFSRVPFLSQSDFSRLTFNKMDSGKPFLKLFDKYIGYSISHTANCYLMGVNNTGEIGVDIERTDRIIHPKLRDRICNEFEKDDETTETLQLWTIKEAVLKLTGTGLRTNMNKVVVERIDEINFQVHHDNKEISIVSLERNGYWISVAWTLTN